MRDVSGGSALRLLSRLPAFRSSVARPARAMLSVWAPPHGTPSQTVCNPGNETQAHLSRTRPRVAAQVTVGACTARIMAKRCTLEICKVCDCVLN